MNTLKIFILLLNIIFIHVTHGLDLKAMNEKIEQYKSRAFSNSQDKSALLQIRTEIKSFLPFLATCINQEQYELQILDSENNLLKKVNINDYALTEKNQLLTLLKTHQDKLAFCELLTVKINYLEKKIAQFNAENYKNNLFEKDTNIFTAFKEFHQKIERKSPNHYSLNKYLSLTRAKANIKIITIWFLFILTCKILNIFHWRYHNLTRSISLIQFIKTVMIYNILMPVQYMILKTNFAPYNEILVDFFQRPIYSLMIICFIFYIYRNIKITSFFKDILLILGHLIIYILTVFMTFELQYLELYNFPPDEILIKKYLLLIFMQPLLISVVYWSFKRIIYLKFIHHWSLKLMCLFSMLIFLVGLMGYTNFAINANYVIIIDTILILLLLVFNNLKNIILHQINDTQSILDLYLEKHMTDIKTKILMNIKIITIFIFILFTTYMTLSLISLTFWFLPETFLNDIYDLVTHKFRSENYSFNFNLTNLFQVYFMISLINILNIYISNIIAKKLFQNRVSQQKTAHLFNWLGYMLTALIMLEFLGFKLRNLMLIFGGLSIGIGFGLNNLISNLVSSFILFFNSPFKIGDYIEIGQTKGIVRKISLLETTIETSDNNTLILPNQIAASSIIHNYTYGNKSFQKIHIKYIIYAFDFKNEELIKTKVIELLKQIPYLLENKNHPIQSTFSLLENTKDACRLEIVFCLSQNLNLKTELTKINRDIFKLLKSLKLDVHYEDMQFPSI